MPFRVEWLALVAALSAGVAYDAAVLFKYPFAVGVDGYYYVLQINELRTQGRLYFPTRTPLILYLLTGVSYLTGDLATAVKISAVTLHAALCGGVFAVVRSLTRSTWLGMLGAALAAVSGPHLYMVTEFVNQLGAITFLMWGAYCALQARGARRRKTWVLLALSCTAAAWLSHVSAIMITLVLGAALVLTRMLIDGSESGGGYRLEALLTVLLLWLAPAILALQQLGGMPAGAESEVLATPRLPLSRAAAAEQMLLMLVCPAVLVIISVAKRGARDFKANLFFGAVALLGVLVTINPFFNNVPGNGLIWRLSVLSYLEVALLVPYLIYLVLPWRRGLAVAVALLVWPLTLWGSYGERPLGIESRRLSRRAELLQRLPALRGQLGPKPIVLSPHGEQFVVTWALGVPSQQAWPEDGSYAVYWLLHNVEPQLLTPSMLIVAPERELGFVVLARNEDVQQLIKPTDEHRRMIVRNRHLLEYISGQNKTH